MRLVAAHDRLPVPERVRSACAEIPDFDASLRLVRLARWWDVWIGGGVAVVAIAGLVAATLGIQRDGVTARAVVMSAIVVLLFGAGLLSWGIGLRMPRVLADRPWRLRPSLLLASVANAALLLPLCAYIAALVLTSAGVVAGGTPAFRWWQWGVQWAGFASPAIGVFANGYAWLRLGRAYDLAVAP